MTMQGDPDQAVTEPNGQQDVDAIAALWVARAGGTALTAAERRDLARWLSSSPEHEAAFAEARAAWAVMGDLRRDPGALARDIVPPRHNTWPAAATLAAVLAVIVALAAVFWLGDPLIALQADYRTGPGERRDVTLADGSRVELGPASALAVRFDADARRVDLLAGQAYVVAAPMGGAEARPFIVAAADGRSRALGTQFAVTREPAAVDVAVVEHAVEVSAGQGRAVLQPGQAVRYGAAGLGVPRPVNADLATAWRRDRLVFDRVPLSDVVAALNRYRHGRIVIADQALAARTVSGVFGTADPDAVLATVVRELGVRATALPPLITLLY